MSKLASVPPAERPAPACTCIVEDAPPADVPRDLFALSEDIYQQVLDMTTDLVFIKGPRSQFLWVNKALCTFYGMTNEQLVGTLDTPYNGADLTQQYIKDDAYVFERGEALIIPEEPAVRHDGEVRTVRTLKVPIRNAKGVVIGTAGMAHDITEQKRREAQELAMQEQRRLIEEQRVTITAMSTPILEIWDGVLTIPLVGVLDSVRAADVMSSLLHAIVDKKAKFTIVDLTGVEVVDTSTANHILRVVQAASLLGARCVLSGISPSVSMTMVSLGVEMGRLRTFGTLRAALRHVLRELPSG